LAERPGPLVDGGGFARIGASRVIGIAEQLPASVTRRTTRQSFKCLLSRDPSTLKDIDRANLVRLSGLSKRALADLLAGRASPKPANLKRLRAIAARHARQRLRAWGIRSARDELAVLERYQAEKVKRVSDRLCEGGCGRKLSGPRQRFCDACKQRRYRTRAEADDPSALRQLY
jgi:hypothetical protein